MATAKPAMTPGDAPEPDKGDALSIVSAALREAGIAAAVSQSPGVHDDVIIVVIHRATGGRG